MFITVKVLISFLLNIISGLPSESNPAQTFSDDRDENTYKYVEINSLNWMTENLRFETDGSMNVSDSTENCEGCGEFYSVEDALSVCPEGWRLPTEKEVKGVIKWHKRNRVSIIESLSIQLCGRVDYGKHRKAGIQNTFWINSELVDGYITHWHTFGDKQELHNHNVVVSKRQFPVRCVCELE